MESYSKNWWKALEQELNTSPQWLEASRYVECRLTLRQEKTAGSITITNGRAIVDDHPSLLGSDIVVSGPDREWERVATGKTDWFEALSPNLGELSLEGDAVAAWRNVKVMALTFEALARTGRTEAPAVAFAPPPRPSGKPTTGHYIDVDGIRAHYEEAGEGQPIICFHAASQDTLMYRHVLDGLSDHFRVISVDAVGHGKSLEPKEGPFQSLTRHAEFNERLIEKLGLHKPVIIGCSMGGNMVLELGARRPDAYAAIISAEGADYTPTVSSFFLDMLLLNGTQILECWARSMTGNRTPPDRAREVVWQICRAMPEVMRGDLTGYANFDKRNAVGAIGCPVLLLRGDADWLVSQSIVEATQSRIPGSKIAVLAGTGHYPMIENPFEFNEAVRAFLREAGVGATSH
ncbi:MAG: alpha/beta fold hydrolase [Xanthobacteraceae bacterium]